MEKVKGKGKAKAGRPVAAGSRPPFSRGPGGKLNSFEIVGMGDYFIAKKNNPQRKLLIAD